MAKKQRNQDAEPNSNPKRVSKRSVKKKAKELKSYKAAAKNAAAPINVSNGEEFTEKPTQYKPKTIPQQIAKFENEGLISKEKPKGEYDVVKKTVQGELSGRTGVSATGSPSYKRAIGKRYSEELRNLSKNSESGVPSAEDYKKVNDKLIDSLGNSGYAPEITTQGVKVDDEGNPQTPAAQIADNIATASVIDKSKSDKELNTELEVNNITDEAILLGEEDIARKNKAIKKVFDETNPDGSIKDQAKTTSTGELAEDLVTKEGIALAQDEVINEMAQGNPEWQDMVKEYQSVARKGKMSGGEPAIEALGLQQYYPDINQPIAKGSYNRATLGSGNIYVGGGGFFPIGVVDARRRALEKAGKAKAKKKQKMMEMMFAQGAVQFQDQIDDMSMDMLNKYGEAAGWDWSKMTDMDTELSRKFMKEIVDHRTFAKRTLYVDGIVKKLQKADLGKDEVETPEFVRNLIYEYASGSFNMSQWKDNKKRFSYIEKNLRAYDSITYTARQIANDIENNPDQSLIDMNGSIDPRDAKDAAEISEALHLIQTGDYDERIWAMKKFVDPKRLDAIVWSHINRDNYYLGEGDKGRQRAFDEMKNNILGRMSHSVELQHKLMNQQRSKRALDWANYSLKKKQVHVQPWTEAGNRIKNSDVKGKLANVAAAGGDPKSVGEAMVALITQNTGMSANVDEGGNIYSVMTPPKDKSAKSHNVPVNQVTFEISTPVGEEYDANGNITKEATSHTTTDMTLSQAQETLKNRPKLSWTPEHHYLMSLSPNDVIKGANMTEGRVMYGNKNDSGTYDYINTGSDAGDIEQSETVGVTYYGGTTEYDVPKYNKAGEVVTQRYVNYVDDAGDSYSKKVYSDADEEKLINKYGADNTNIVEKPITEKKRITLPRTRRAVNIDDDVNLQPLNKYYGTKGELKEDVLQDEVDYYPDNSGKGYTTTNNSGETKKYN